MGELEGVQNGNTKGSVRSFIKKNGGLFAGEMWSQAPITANLFCSLSNGGLLNFPCGKELPPISSSRGSGPMLLNGIGIVSRPPFTSGISGFFCARLRFRFAKLLLLIGPVTGFPCSGVAARSMRPIVILLILHTVALGDSFFQVGKSICQTERTPLSSPSLS